MRGNLLPTSGESLNSYHVFFDNPLAARRFWRMEVGFGRGRGSIVRGPGVACEASPHARTGCAHAPWWALQNTGRSRNEYLGKDWVMNISLIGP